ncbi:lipoprotein NlpD [Klebsiella michiganensis]|nr:lipoprotein NlpD [Klebsiella michiganensis]
MSRPQMGASSMPVNALRGYGNLIIIKHNDDYLSAYAHNDTMLVKEQQDIKAGQKIATHG